MAVTGVAAMASAINPLLGIGILAADFATDMMGLDLATAGLNAMDHMDSEYNRLGKTGSNYQMSQGSAQAMQRQLQNLAGSGSNVAEMMHN